MTTATQRNITTRMPTNDIFKTTYGVGHHWKPGYYFPEDDFHASMKDPLPPLLAKPPEIIAEDHFRTTTGTTHDSKYPFGELQQRPIFKKAPAHSRVYYLKDFMENMHNQEYRRPLSPSNQKSETHDEFCDRQVLSQPEKWLNVQPFNLYNHHIDGPSKKIIPSTENSRLAGRILLPKDHEVLRNLDPYLTTYNKCHRIFDPKEWNGVSKKNVSTYWDCEEYPKAWGHGPKSNLLSKSSVPREQLPMRDTSVFKYPTFIRRVPRLSEIVPHSGMLTEYDENFKIPRDCRSKDSHTCPVDYPSILPDSNSQTKYDVPRMYETEYESYGKDVPTTIL